MEAGEPYQLIKAKYIIEIRFPGAASFHSEKGNIAAAFNRAPFEHWQIDQFRANVSTEENRMLAFVSSKNAGFTSVLPESRADFHGSALEFLTMVSRTLGLNRLIRAGFRAMIIIPMEDFESAVDFHRNRIHAQVDDHLPALGNAVDYGSTWTLQIDENRANVSIGPMERVQLKQILETELPDEMFPEAMLFTDFDYAIDEPAVSRRLERFVDQFLDEGISQTVSRVARFYESLGLELEG